MSHICYIVQRLDHQLELLNTSLILRLTACQGIFVYFVLLLVMATDNDASTTKLDSFYSFLKFKSLIFSIFKFNVKCLN